MPITLPNGSKYKLCLLDTNALSEIVKRPTNEGRGYIERFFLSEYVPCFTVYNLIEIRRHPDVYRKFLAFFKVYPSFITKPLPQILEVEIASKGRASVLDVLLHAFTPLGQDSSYDLGEFLDRLFKCVAINRIEQEWRKCDQDVLNAWVRNKKNFIAYSSVPNIRDAKRFVHDACIDTLCLMHPEFVEASIQDKDVSVLQTLPSLQAILYSQYFRVFDPSWNLDNQEATDVYISSAAPYVDAVVTERRQAEIYRKSQKHINGMNAIVATLGDIRYRN